jgi:O-antigen ligase
VSELIAIPLIACARGSLTGRTLIRIAFAGTAATVLLVGVVGWQNILQRFQESSPYALRANLVRSSIAMARDRPWRGFGLGSWSAVYPAYALFDDGDFVNQAHNDWIQWLDEGGVPFLILLIAIVVLLVRPAFRSLWGLGLITVFIHALVDYPFQQRPALAAFFFAMAGALAAEATSSPARNPPGERSRDPWLRSSLPGD